ncbi:MAG: S41 family peptidase [Bacteroidota bacterium]
MFQKTKVFLVILVCLIVLSANGQTAPKYELMVKEDLDRLLSALEQDYVYFQDKSIALSCLRENYENQITTLKTKEQALLFFESILHEFYDNHLTLSANTTASYRLYAPLYVSYTKDAYTVTQVWFSHLQSIPFNPLHTEVLAINGIPFTTAIANFPCYCSDKDNPVVKEWIANKLIAGRYNQSRILTLKNDTGAVEAIDLDAFRYRSSAKLVERQEKSDIGIIIVNNALGNNETIAAFDKALDDLSTTQGLILDLRNTVDGGNSYVARGIMGRFIRKPLPYQKHAFLEHYDGQAPVERSWLEIVSPRDNTYDEQLVVLVGRWTGSMGEGLAIGFDGMERAIVVGTEMERLAGEISYFQFKHQDFGFRMATAKLFHVNGTPREEFAPSYYGYRTGIKEDTLLDYALTLLKN